MSVLLLAIFMATSAQMIHLASRQQRSMERRAAAMLYLQAAAELLSNTEWDQLTPENIKQLAIPEQLKAGVPNAKLDCQIADEADPPAKRINMTLSAGNSNGQQPMSARLTVWAFPQPATTRP
jgi:hypothetical protein